VWIFLRWVRSGVRGAGRSRRGCGSSCAGCVPAFEAQEDPDAASPARRLSPHR